MANNRTFTPKQSEFLAEWLGQPPPRPSIRSFCKQKGFSESTVSGWRSDEKFRAAMEGRALENDEIDTLASERWPDLDPWKGQWLECYRSTRDRMESSRYVRKIWREIEQAFKDDQGFLEGYEEVRAEFLVEVEDSYQRAALAGKGTTAGNYLEAMKSEFSKSAGRGGKDPGVRDSKAARSRYAEIFKLHHGGKGKKNQA